MQFNYTKIAKELNAVLDHNDADEGTLAIRYFGIIIDRKRLHQPAIAQLSEVLYEHHNLSIQIAGEKVMIARVSDETDCTLRPILKRTRVRVSAAA